MPSRIDKDERALRDERAKRLVQARKNAGYAGPKAVADKFRWKLDTYKGHESGRNGFGLADANKYAAAFNVEVEWLNFGKDAPLGEHHTVPLTEWDPAAPEAIDPDRPPTIGTETGVRGIPQGASPEIDLTAGLGAGGFSVVANSVIGKGGMTFAADVVRDYWRLPDWWLQKFGSARPEHIVAFRTEGDSMAPRIMSGDVVFIDIRRRVPSPEGLYGIEDEFGGIAIKRIDVIESTSPDEPTKLRISSDNPKHQVKVRPIDEVRIVGAFVSRVTEF